MGYRILVTGGAGYLGSILVPELLRSGNRVTVIDSFLYGQASLNHVCFHPDFSVVRGDVREKDTILPLLRQSDFIIPLAALVGAPICERDPIGATTTNHHAVTMMLQNVSPQQGIIMPTTNSAYGSGDANNFCDEASPLKPLSRYARDKVQVEKELMQHPGSISLRLATVFGMSPRMRLDLLVNDFVYRALHDRALVLYESHFKRNYIHVRDIARVFLHAIENFDSMRGQIYNVGLSEANLSKQELAERIRQHLPDTAIVEASQGKDPDQRNYVVSNAKIERTGWMPTVSLDDGIQELIKGLVMLRNTRYGNV